MISSIGFSQLLTSMNTYPLLNVVSTNIKPTGSSHMTRLGIPVEAQVETLKHTENNFPDVESIVYFERDLNYFKAGKWMTKQVAVLMKKKKSNSLVGTV